MTDDEQLPPGPDISIAANYRDGCVWVISSQGRKCLSPPLARELADTIEGMTTDADADAGYQHQEAVDEIRRIADVVETE